MGADSYSHGAVSWGEDTTWPNNVENSNDRRYHGSLLLDANIDRNNYGNPMAGHATGPDIHPYSIYLVPLISY